MLPPMRRPDFEWLLQDVRAKLGPLEQPLSYMVEHEGLLDSGVDARSSLIGWLTSTADYILRLDGDVSSEAAVLRLRLGNLEPDPLDQDPSVDQQIIRESLEFQRGFTGAAAGFIWLILLGLQSLRRYDDMYTTDHARKARELLLQVGVSVIQANGKDSQGTKSGFNTLCNAFLTASRNPGADARTLAEEVTGEKIRMPQGEQGTKEESSDEKAQLLSTQTEAAGVAAPAATRVAGVRGLDEILTELRGLIGLEAVKQDVEQLMAFLVVQQRRKSHGLASVPLSLHLVFYGNPGTGKTTVARLIAECYRALGALPKGQLVETDRSGLVAGYLGQTAIKVTEVVNKALGGVLFIDEAYALAPAERDDPYGSEAIATLLKVIEDHREELAVIVAGYPAKMQLFLGSNPGIRSRFNKYLSFEDYTPEQLVSIFKRFCAQNGYALADSAQTKLVGLFTKAYGQRDETFGNARFARNVFERALERQATRIVRVQVATDELLSTIEKEDILEPATS
jgi:stage V sporulation protein K